MITCGQRGDEQSSVQVTLESSVIFHSVWKTVMIQMPRWKVQLKNNSSGAFILVRGTLFSVGSGVEGDRQSAVILSHSPCAFNLSSKKLFTVNCLDHLSSFHGSSSVLSWS